jgi:dUTP pyrophosphatase
MKIKRLHPVAKMPTKGTKGAAGYDLFCTELTTIRAGQTLKVPTGLAFEVPEGFCMVVYSRSSSMKNGLIITPLIVDSDYRGEVFVLVRNVNDAAYTVEVGDRIAQVKLEALHPMDFEWTTELSETSRDTGGFGSTGR